MNIRLAEHFGLCFGVRDAIAQAESLAAAGPLTVLGELVHNPIVQQRLSALGARTASLEDDPARIGTPVLFTAHGVSDAERARWAGAADATCPLVRHAHDKLRGLVAAGCHPVVIGLRDHVEVRGLTGDFPGATVIASDADLAALPHDRPLGVIAQTTQPIARVESLVAAIRAARPGVEVRFVDTVCAPTKNRQRALQLLIASCELIVVVGGRASNNTRELVSTVRSAGRRAIHVESPDELWPQDFAGVAEVGVTAGTSTLRETVEEVCARLRAFAPEQPA
ncbi:MAG: 4-hydroxy-3-methylbut-2-enyl diphosphate reductase [Verrucomicrobia bacterium]|nr:4-hydroxy-3-methylbut-2-enyl diphosphate reductase [Verrucomicrobiota bacterium]